MRKYGPDRRRKYEPQELLNRFGVESPVGVLDTLHNQLEALTGSFGFDDCEFRKALFCPVRCNFDPQKHYARKQNRWSIPISIRHIRMCTGPSHGFRVCGLSGI